MEKILSDIPIYLGNISEYLQQFDQFLNTQLGAIPSPLVYLFGLIIIALLLYTLVKFIINLALRVVLPTLGSSLVLVYVFPSLDTAKVMPLAGILFIILFIFKH